MKLSIAQIQSLMRQAGWPEDLIVTGAAVFYFESAHGDPHAHKVDRVEQSYGLAQVNRNAWPQYSVADLYDPLFNLQVAYQIYRQQGWRAWTNTYYGGRYQPFMAESRAVYGGGGSGSGADFDNFFGIPVDYDASGEGGAADQVFDLNDYLPGTANPFDSSSGIGGPLLVVGFAVVGFLVLDSFLSG